MLRRFNDATNDDTLTENEIVYIERKKNCWLGDALLHEVREGEDLHALSQAFGIRKKNLARLNHLRTNSKVEKGQTIRIR